MLQDDSWWVRACSAEGFNGHPPLGVNATKAALAELKAERRAAFQRAPTLGGECYNYHTTKHSITLYDDVSTGTHPWG